MEVSGSSGALLRPLVTVVIPSYNRSDLVLRALASVLRQTYRPIDVVVVDDASDPPLANPAATFAELDLQFVRRDVRGGPGAARNSAGAFVRGEFVSFLDSDDEWVPTKLERQVRRLMSLGGRAQPRMLVCGFERSSGSKRWLVTPPDGRVYTQTSLLAGSAVPLTASVMMIDAELFRSGGLRFDERLSALEDLDLAIQVAAVGTVVCQNEILTLKYRDDDREHAYTSEADIESRRTLASKYELVLQANARARIGFETRRVVGLIAAGMDAEAASVVLATARHRALLGQLSARIVAATIRSPARPLVRALGRGSLRMRRASDRGDYVSRPAAPTRVAFVLPNLEVGGVQRAHLLIGRYSSHEIEPLFVALHAKDNDRRPSLQPTFEAAGLRVRDLGLRARADRSPGALALGAWRLRRLCRREGIDVVDSCIVEADLVSRLATVGSSTIQVTHLVSTTYDSAVELRLSGRSRARFAVLRTIDALTARSTDAFVALTHGVAASAQRHLHIDPRKMTVIPRGVDLAEFPYAPNATDSTVPLRILSIGRLTPSKGHDVTLRAVAHLQESGVHAELVVAGDGPLLDELRQLARDLSIESKVSFVGAVDGATIRSLLAAAHVFCFPSRWEGQGNALLEAMASGCPIVASAIATIREVLGATGSLVTPDDSVAFAKELQRVGELSRTERMRLSREARREVEMRFDAADRVRDLEAFYLRLLNKSARLPELAKLRSGSDGNSPIASTQGVS